MGNAMVEVSPRTLGVEQMTLSEIASLRLHQELLGDQRHNGLEKNDAG